jgi:hypothetical protein
MTAMLVLLLEIKNVQRRRGVCSGMIVMLNFVRSSLLVFLMLTFAVQLSQGTGVPLNSRGIGFSHHLEELNKKYENLLTYPTSEIRIEPRPPMNVK